MNKDLNTTGFRFLEWQVYTDSQNFYKQIHELTKTFPKSIRFESTNQLLRSSLSITLNIAEGSGKNSDKDLARYLDISMGSLYETVACLDSLRLTKVISDDVFINLKTIGNNLAKQIGGFRNSLRNKI